MGKALAVLALMSFLSVLSACGGGSNYPVVPQSEAPTITTQPQSQTVTAGHTATFSVVASGTTPLSYQWKKNSTAIASATASSYTTPSTITADSGASFTVTVTNSAGNITSNAAILTVNAASLTPQTITFANPGTQTVGTPLTLVATASSGLAVSFASTTTGVCTVSGTIATFIASGSCTIQATQPGNATYAAATPVSQSFAVNASIPLAPTGLTAAAGNATVLLNWTAAAAANSYNVYRGTTAGGESATPIATGITVPTYTDASVTNNTTFYYKVAGVNSAGTGPMSNEASATPGTSPVTPILIASRLSGYAPLAVHFDATGATSTTPGIGDPDQGGTFRQIKHSFDFGDPNSGTHSIDGMSKNSEPLGAGLAAHVYDVPGIYTVTVTSTDGSGPAATASVTITVDDPSVLPTYAISQSGDFTGAPAGATLLHQSTLPTFESNSRYFFHRGEDWSGSRIDIEDPLANVHIDAYGTGANPTFDAVWVGNWRPNTSAFPTDIRVSNVTTSSGGFSQQNGSRVLFYKCNGVPSSSVGQSWTATDPYMYIQQSDFINSHEIFFVDCQFLGDSTSTGYNLYGNGSRLVFLNTYSKGTAVGNIRIVGWERGVMRHSRIESPTNSFFHALKVHSGGPNAYDDNWLASGGTNPITGGSINWTTSKLVFANNYFGGGDNDAIANWTVAVCPQNDGYGLAGAEPIEDVILENNNFIHAAAWGGSNVDIAWGGRNLTSRGNSVVQGSGSIVVGKGHAQVKAYDGPYFTQ